MKYWILTMLVIGFYSCNEDDDNIAMENCDFNALINANLFENAPNDPLSINSLEINENCLQITFNASGCDGNTWELNLIDSEQILESTPLAYKVLPGKYCSHS